MGNCIKHSNPAVQSIRPLRPISIYQVPEVIPRKPFLHTTSLKEVLKRNMPPEIRSHNKISINYSKMSDPDIPDMFAKKLKRQIKVHQWKIRSKVQIKCKDSRLNHRENTLDVNQVVNTLPNIPHLAIKFKSCFTTSIRGLELITDNIRRKAPTLQHLTVSFYGGGLVGETKFSEIQEKLLKNLRDVKAIEFTVAWNSKISYYGHEENIIETYKFCPRLKSAALHFRSPYMMKNQTLQALEAKITRNKTLIKDLTLDFCPPNNSKCQLSEVVLDQMTRVLSKFSNLQSLVLAFKLPNSSIGEDFLNFGKTIGTYLPKLKHLDIRLGECQNIPDDIYESFVDYILGQNKSLTHLTLHFNQCTIFSDKRLKSMMSLIVKQAPYLQHFYLCLTDSLYVTDKGLNSLLSKIGQTLTELESLYLKFVNCPLVGLDKFSFLPVRNSSAPQKHRKLNQRELLIMKNLQNLKHLKVCFDGCSYLTDENFSTFLFRISRHLPQLQELSIILRNCKTVMNMPMEHLAGPVIQNLSKLQQFKLCLRGCREFTENERRKFRDYMTINFPKLHTMAGLYNV